MSLLERNLYYYRKQNTATVLAVGTCIAVITGALLIGSTIKYNLRKTAEARLGFVSYAAITPAATIDTTLPQSIESTFRTKYNISAVKAAAVNFRLGSIINPSDMYRINNVQILGIDNMLAEATGVNIFSNLPGNHAVINKETADRLGLKIDDDIVVKFSADNLVGELALYSGEDFEKSWRLTVSAIAGPDEFGSFSLKAQQVSSYNIFVPAAQLAEKLEIQDRRNMLLADIDITADTQTVINAVSGCFSLSDLGYTITNEENFSSVKTDKIFISDDITDSLVGQIEGATAFTGYLINKIQTDSGKNSYYCFCGTSPDIGNDEVIISNWLAEKLGISTGDELTLKYYKPADNNQLFEMSVKIKISSIENVQYFRYMEKLLPVIPGMTDSASCSDWKSGVPIDLEQITDADEHYWKDYGMTPKLAISYNLAQRLFGGRYGLATAIYKDNQFTNAEIDKIQQVISANAKPVIIPAASNAKFAVDNSMDFGGLFLSLSMFLIASSLLLPAILFGLNIHDRQNEFASLSALGYSHAKIKKIIYLEIAILAAMGSLAGVFPGIAYAWWLQTILSTGFSGAIADFNMQLHIDLPSLIYGYLSGFIMILIVSFLKIRKILKQTTIIQSIKKTYQQKDIRKRRITYLITSLILVISALLLPLFFSMSLMSFFSGGSLLLIGGITLSTYFFSRKINTSIFSLNNLIWNNLCRNSNSTIAVTASIACGVFMVIAVGLNHFNPLENSELPSGPTGGFDKVAICSIPVNEQLHSNSDFLAFRVHNGDDASCLNLNRPVSPTIIAADYDKLIARNPFSFAAAVKGKNKDFSILKDDNPEDNIIPAVADNDSIMWALHKKIGDTIETKDQYGNSVSLKLCGGLQNSILQGKIFIDEEAYKKLYPNENGYSLILFNKDHHLEKQLLSHEAEIRPAVDVIGDFYKVENTYMSLFALLGGLGLIMGNIILGLTVVRNCQSQTREYAIMRAMGYTTNTLKKLITRTYLIPVSIGITIAVISATYSVWPKIATNYANLPVIMILILLAGIFITAALCISLAGNAAVRANITKTLRNQ